MKTTKIWPDQINLLLLGFCLSKIEPIDQKEKKKKEKRKKKTLIWIEFSCTQNQLI